MTCSIPPLVFYFPRHHHHHHYHHCSIHDYYSYGLFVGIRGAYDVVLFFYTFRIVWGDFLVVAPALLDFLALALLDLSRVLFLAPSQQLHRGFWFLFYTFRGVFLLLLAPFLPPLALITYFVRIGINTLH